MAEQEVVSVLQPVGLADILERILDKGVVIVGDIRVNLADVELLTIKIRLLVSSVERAQALGIDWWAQDASFSSRAKQMSEENDLLRQRLERLEKKIEENAVTPTQSVGVRGKKGSKEKGGG